MNINLDGANILSEKDFHRELAIALGVEEFYGCNLDALWDLLSASVERPLNIKWVRHDLSKDKMGDDFYKVIEILERVKVQDEDFGCQEKFSYALD
jgi:ribonuclease inhibitor